VALNYIYRLTVGILICFTLTGEKALSQQDNYYMLENFVSFRNNPAYTGNRDLNDLMILTRQQWTGFEGAPTNYLLAVHFPLRDKNASIGADIQHNSIGPETETKIFLNYSYKIVLGENSSLWLGLKGGADIIQINLSDLLVIDQGDNFFETNVDNIVKPNFGTGLHFVYKNYYLDLSMPTMLRNKLSPRGATKVNNENVQDRSVIAGSGSKFRIADEITLHPAVSIWLVKGAPVLVDTRVSATYRMLGAGVVYRPGSAAGGFFDLTFRVSLKIGYAYELATGMLRGVRSGSHEVYLGYNFSFTKQKTLSPRRF